MKPGDSEATAQASLVQPEVEDIGATARSHMYIPDRHRGEAGMTVTTREGSGQGRHGRTTPRSPQDHKEHSKDLRNTPQW